MAQQPQIQSRDVLANLDRNTERLEVELAKLTKNYDHWRLWEAEYEALSDEVHQANRRFPNASSDATEEKDQKAELVRIRRDFDGMLVDHATVYELFGARLGQTITRSVDSIAAAIGRRLDYVQQNTATLKRQVEEAANRLAAAQVVRRPGAPAPGDDDDAAEDEDSGFEGAEDDDGNYGPVTDIMEELDEDDNVIGYQLHTPSSTQSQVMEALKKAGVDEIPAGGSSQAKAAAEGSSSKPEETTKDATGKKENNDEEKPAAAEPPKAAQTQKSSLKPTPRRSVSFADDTKDGGNDEGPSESEGTFAAQRLAKIIQSAKDQESLVDANAVIPENEDEDEAVLRREMLEYSMSEIGPIVAQLDIEEGVSDDEGFNDEDYDDDFFDDDDEGEDDEDHFGRSNYSVIDEAYRERMKELEKMLGVTPLNNQSIVPTPNAINPEDFAESLGRIRISAADAEVLGPGTKYKTDQKEKAKTAPASVLKEPTPSFRAKAKAASGEGKKVSFASGLDIAPEKEIVREVTAPAEKSAPAEPFVDPLSDVIERRSAPRTASAPGSEAKPKRVSRFKAARGEDTIATENAAPSAPATPKAPILPKGPHQAPVRFLDEDRIVAPSGPQGKTHSEDVFERQALTEPKEPHELDAHLVFQETATEYHRTRNRLIQQEGGFMKASESAVVTVGQEDGGPRISKFKAARLGQQFMN